MPPELPELIHSQDPGAEDQWRTVEHLHLLLSHRNYGPIRRAYRKHRRHRLFRGAGHRYPGGLQPEVLNPATGSYSNNTVTANLLRWFYGLVPKGYEEMVFRHIVDKTMVDFDGHVSTGLVGIRHLMQGLTRHGRARHRPAAGDQPRLPELGLYGREGSDYDLGAVER